MGIITKTDAYNVLPRIAK